MCTNTIYDFINKVKRKRSIFSYNKFVALGSSQAKLLLTHIHHSSHTAPPS